MSLASHFIQINALIGALLPLLVAVVQQQHWPEWLRVTVGVGSSVVASVVSCLALNKLNLQDWGASFITVFLTTKTTYLSVWKPSNATGFIEALTSMSGRTQASLEEKG